MTTDDVARAVSLAFALLSSWFACYAVGMWRGAGFVRAARSDRIRRLEDERFQLCEELGEARRELAHKEEELEEDLYEDVMERAFAALEESGLDYADTRTAHDTAAIFIDRNGEQHEFWPAPSGQVNVVIAVDAERLPDVTHDVLDLLCPERIADVGDGMVPMYHTTSSVEEAEEVVSNCCGIDGCGCDDS